MRRKLSEGQSAKLARELAGLAHLDENGLNNHFRQLYGVEQPPRLRRPLLIRAVAYRIQERALGGLKPSARQLLVSLLTTLGGDGAFMRGTSARSSPGQLCCANGMASSTG